MTDSSLFSPLRVGRYDLNNRVTMAALTRSRAGRSGTPTQLHVDYYSQRASAGLIVTEGTFPAVNTRAFPGQAGIETHEHQEGWRKVADAVHARGGTIFMQVMHGGRLSHPELLDGQQPEAPSAIASGTAVRDWESRKECPVPRALEHDEIPRVVHQFRQATRRAVDAGIDGVEIHGANGYILHQFLGPTSNHRTDEYGGSPENRARLLVEVVRAVAEEIGGDRVALRLSPQHNVQGVIEDDEQDVQATYRAVIDSLSELNLAYISFLHAECDGPLITDLATRARSNGVTKVIGNNGFAAYTQLDDATSLVNLSHIDAVAVGRLLIANPDLVERWQQGLELNTPDESTFYTGGQHGYTDYPFAGQVGTPRKVGAPTFRKQT